VSIKGPDGSSCPFACCSIALIKQKAGFFAILHSPLLSLVGLPSLSLNLQVWPH
jgi:hypothetical protein